MNSYRVFYQAFRNKETLIARPVSGPSLKPVVPYQREYGAGR